MLAYVGRFINLPARKNSVFMHALTQSPNDEAHAVEVLAGRGAGAAPTHAEK